MWCGVPGVVLNSNALNDIYGRSIQLYDRIFRVTEVLKIERSRRTREMLTLRIPADRPIAFALPLGTIGGAGGYKYRMLGAQLGESRGSRELYV